MAVVVCSLSAWSQPQLLKLAVEILNNNQSVSKIEEILVENEFSVFEKDFDEYVNCTFSISAVNNEYAYSTATDTPQVTLEYSNNCSKRIAIAKFVLPIQSNYYNALNEQLSQYGFSLIEDDGNELIYRNEAKIQCNFIFSDNGEVTLFVHKRTNTLW